MSSGAGGADGGRILIASAGIPDNPHAHLDVVVAAEVRWGNRVLRHWYITDPHFGYWDLRLARPFHVEQLRAAFVFPPRIGMSVVATRRGLQHASMSLGDTLNLVSITSPLSPDWPDADAEIELTTS
jgi:hypothetical protein